MSYPVRYIDVGDAQALGYVDTGDSPAGQAQVGNWTCHFGSDEWWKAGVNYGGKIACKLPRFRVYKAQVTGPVGAWFNVYRGLRIFTTANLLAAGTTGVQDWDPYNKMRLSGGVEVWFTFSSAVAPSPVVTLWFEAEERDVIR